METQAVNTDSLSGSQCCGDCRDQWQLAVLQTAFSNTVAGPDMLIDRCAHRFRITGSQTSIAFEPKAIRVGHDLAEERMG